MAAEGWWGTEPPGRPDPASASLSQVQLINNAYRLVVDAVLGPGVEPAEVGGPCTRALATLKLLSIPLVSLDLRHARWREGMRGREAGLGRGPSPLVSGGPSLFAHPSMLPHQGWLLHSG